jgi:poly(3-hydroxybutyrate) depolymerase
MHPVRRLAVLMICRASVICAALLLVGISQHVSAVLAAQSHPAYGWKSTCIASTVALHTTSYTRMARQQSFAATNKCKQGTKESNAYSCKKARRESMCTDEKRISRLSLNVVSHETSAEVSIHEIINAQSKTHTTSEACH